MTSTTEHNKFNVGYFVNWAIYARNYFPKNIPVAELTHINYAFANLRPDSGEVFLSDEWADIEKHYEGDSWNEPGNNLYGNFKQIFLLKKANRHLKVLLSIGGWTYSSSFHPVVVDPQLRKKFVESSIKILEDVGLDGLDIDYEYPETDEQAKGYVDLLKDLRAGLDEHASQKGIDYKFLLTIAAPCGPEKYTKLYIPEMDESLDFWNLMAYDYSGSWDAIANHQANVYGPPINTSDAVIYYTDKGVASNKVVIGIPLYGRSFCGTNGPGTSFTGVGTGSWETGVYDYRHLPLENSTVSYDYEAIASWSYDSTKREMVSFDDEIIAKRKAEWILKQSLRGGMYWELSGDKGWNVDGKATEKGLEDQPGESLVTVVKDTFGDIDQGENWLQYEGSQYDNMKNGMQS